MTKWNKFLTEGELKTVGVVACLNDEQQFLVIRRSDIDDREGEWTLPGGHIDEKDGSIEAGAVRELKEEAGLTCKISDLVYLGEPKSKKYCITDENGLREGSSVKVKIEKSRFGSEGRTCGFQITWGKSVGIQDEESWFEALKASGSNRFKTGAWNKMFDRDGKEFKFQRSSWIKKLQDKEFRACVFDIMDEEIIKLFESEGKNFGIEGESEEA